MASQVVVGVKNDEDCKTVRRGFEGTLVLSVRRDYSLHTCLLPWDDDRLWLHAGIIISICLGV